MTECTECSFYYDVKLTECTEWCQNFIPWLIQGDRMNKMLLKRGSRTSIECSFYYNFQLKECTECNSIQEFYLTEYTECDQSDRM